MATQDRYDANMTYNVFQNLLKDLSGFVDTGGVELIFDSQQNVFLSGPGFREQLTANPTLHREIREQMRDILAKYLGRNSQQG